MKAYKFVAAILVSYSVGYVISDMHANEVWEEKFSQEVNRQREIRKVMIESERKLAIDLALENFLTVLYTTCMGPGKFSLKVESSDNEINFECKPEGKGEFAMAWR